MEHDYNDTMLECAKLAIRNLDVDILKKFLSEHMISMPKRWYDRDIFLKYIIRRYEESTSVKVEIIFSKGEDVNQQLYPGEDEIKDVLFLN